MDYFLVSAGVGVGSQSARAAAPAQRVGRSWHDGPSVETARLTDLPTAESVCVVRRLPKARDGQQSLRQRPESEDVDSIAWREAWASAGPARVRAPARQAGPTEQELAPPLPDLHPPALYAGAGPVRRAGKAQGGHAPWQHAQAEQETHAEAQSVRAGAQARRAKGGRHEQIVRHPGEGGLGAEVLVIPGAASVVSGRRGASRQAAHQAPDAPVPDAAFCPDGQSVKRTRSAAEARRGAEDGSVLVEWAAPAWWSSASGASVAARQRARGGSASRPDGLESWQGAAVASALSLLGWMGGGVSVPARAPGGGGGGGVLTLSVEFAAGPAVQGQDVCVRAGRLPPRGASVSVAAPDWHGAGLVAYAGAVVPEGD